MMLFWTWSVTVLLLVWVQCPVESGMVMMMMCSCTKLWMPDDARWIRQLWMPDDFKNWVVECSCGCHMMPDGSNSCWSACFPALFARKICQFPFFARKKNLQSGHLSFPLICDVHHALVIVSSMNSSSFARTWPWPFSTPQTSGLVLSMKQVPPKWTSQISIDLWRTWCLRFQHDFRFSLAPIHATASWSCWGLVLRCRNQVDFFQLLEATVLFPPAASCGFANLWVAGESFVRRQTCARCKMLEKRQDSKCICCSRFPFSSL